MNTLKKIILQSLFFFIPSLLFATAPQTNNTTASPEKNTLAVFYTLEGDIEKPFNAIVENELKTIGFNITDPHKRVNDQYKKKYGSTVLDVLSFMSVVNDTDVLPLLNIDPRIAGFSPFNMLIHKKLDEDVTHVGHLMPTVILDILGIEDATVREKFTASLKPLDEKLEAEFKAKGLKFKKSYTPYKKLAQKRMINFEFEFEVPEDIDDFIDEFQEKFEEAFIEKKYLIAGYHNFMEGSDNAPEILKDYAAFWTYSLCHLEYSYNMFDNKDAHPEAGLFAPCSMYMYIKKGSNKLVIGMPSLANWSDTLGIIDEKRVGLVHQLDTEIPAILTSLGMKAVSNVNPLTQISKIKTATPKKEVTAQTVTKPVATDMPKDTLAVFYTFEGDIQKPFNDMVENTLKGIDFYTSDPHKRVNDQYEKKYGSTILDVLSFMPIVNDRKILPLLNIDPRIAGFTPFNMLIHKKLDEKNTHIGHLVPTAMLDILGVQDKTVREQFIASFKPLDEKIEADFKAKGLKFKKSYLPYKNLAQHRMINFEYEFERPEDIDDFIDAFQNKFSLAFMDKQYLIAGYHNFMYDLEDAEEILEGYDAFWVYSLCHLEYSYNMFDNKGARPEAGLFAPCSMYMYIKKDSNKLVIGMPTLVNVLDTLDITDEKRVAYAHRLDTEIPGILTSLGMKAVTNVNPLTETPTALIVKKDLVVKESDPTPVKKETIPAVIAQKQTVVAKKKTKKITPKAKTLTIKNGGETIRITIPKPPKVPSVIQVKTISSNGTIDGDTRSIKFSKRIPPNYIPPEQRTQEAKPENTSTNIGEVTKGKIAAYLRGKFMDVEAAKAKLKKAGFEIIAVTPVTKKGDLISIVFSDKTLLKMASRPNRGFIASLRLLVNKKDNHISITNPLYMAKAFMQQEFDENTAKETLIKLTSVFTGMLNSKDMLKFQLLPKYQFMSGMPHYEEMTIVARGKDLLSKIKNNKKVVFSQTLENGATLIGVKLHKRTQKFTGRIGTNNAALLPYPILIENGEAKILDPKYYISVMYPLLQMSEFMTIATIPGAIVKDCEKVFK
jgi:uncharacterized protein (DUF302 family)